MQRDKSREVLSVQYLRAVAALLVVFYHSRQFPGFEAAIGTTVGNTGVDIFFVISGFVMAVTAGRANYPAALFLGRRIIRIVPLYWAVTLVTAAMLFVLPSLFRDNAFTWSHLSRSLLFIPHPSPDNAHDYSPLVKVGWTLNFEMFFYVVFAVLAKFRLETKIAAMTAFFASLVILKFVGGLPWAPLRYWADGQLFEFVMGCVVGWLYVKGHLQRLGIAGGCLAMALGVAGLLAFGVYHPGATRVFVAGIPSAFLVMGAVSLEERGSIPTVAGAKFLGDASYSIYLTHLFPIALLRKAWMVEHFPHDELSAALLFSGLSIALGIAFATAIYLLFEKPVTRYLQRRLAATRTRKSLAMSDQVTGVASGMTGASATVRNTGTADLRSGAFPGWRAVGRGIRSGFVRSRSGALSQRRSRSARQPNG